MHGHELHRVLAPGGLVFAGLQGGRGEEGIQALVFAFHGEGGGGGGQFAQFSTRSSPSFSFL